MLHLLPYNSETSWKADAATIPNSSYFFEHLPFTSGLHALWAHLTQKAIFNLHYQIHIRAYLIHVDTETLTLTLIFTLILTLILTIVLTLILTLILTPTF